jgi:hypothetical protein
VAGRRHLPGAPTAPWCTGWARFWIDRPQRSHLLTVAARCRFGSLAEIETVLLDTGAQWSVLGGELAREVEADAFDLETDIILATRLGAARGRLHEISVSLLAEEGEDVTLSATVVLAPSWSGPPVIGYRGFLERLRFGFDPGEGPDDQWLFFAGAS